MLSNETLKAIAARIEANDQPGIEVTAALLAEVWRLREELGWIALDATSDPKGTANLALGLPADH